MSSHDQFETRQEIEAALRTALREPEGIPSTEPTTPERQWYRELAAVLGPFSPSDLDDLWGDAKASKKGWPGGVLDIAPDCEVVARGNWLLKSEVRSEVLAQLVSEDRLVGALASTDNLKQDPYRQAFEELSRGEPLSLANRSVEELRCLRQVLQWFGRNAPVRISIEEVQQALDARQLVEPFYKLAQNFRGRDSELNRLRDFVEVYRASNIYEGITRGVRGAVGIKRRTPQVMWGPGGIGKSALISRFILEHARIGEHVAAKVEGPLKIPYVYLDFDRVELDPLRPESLLTDVVLQLVKQYPDREFEKLAIDWQRRIKKSQRRTARTAPNGPRISDVRPDHKLIKQILTRLDDWMGNRITQDHETQPPLLLVLDTFEEVQLGGEARERQAASFINDFQSIYSHLRVVICGRAKMRYLEAEQHELKGLDDHAADQLLADRAVDGPDLREAIISRVGTSPLSLILAAEAVAQSSKENQTEALDEIRTHNWLFQRIDAAEIQGQLYHRILKHIRDLRVRKLAHPGLVMRRITPDIIRYVLAKPCGLDPNDAGELFELIGQNVSLVNRNPDGSLQHRPDVRRIMLRSMLSGTRYTRAIHEIHRAAVDYYATQSNPDPGTIGEQVYHMLMLDAAGAELEELATRADRRSLELAWEDPMPPLAHTWLTRYLGIESEAADWQAARLDDWEQHVRGKVEELLAIGENERALARLDEREDRTPGSPLYELEALALGAIGRVREALKVVDMGTNSAQGARRADVALKLCLIGANLAFSIKDHILFRRYLNEGFELAQTEKDAVASLALARLRLDGQRQLESNKNSEEEATTKLVDVFLQTPADVLRDEGELVGGILNDIGADHPIMLEHVIRVLKPVNPGEEGIERLAAVLTNADTSRGFQQRKHALFRELGVSDENAPWSTVIERASTYGTFDKALTAAVRYGSLNASDLKTVAEIMAPNFSALK